MKFQCSVEIDLPIDKVVSLFDDPKNLPHWQDGFLGTEHISGTPGEPGTQTILSYLVGKKELDLTETIIVKNLPDEFIATYEAPAMTKTMTTRFTKLGESKTKYIADVEYTKFNGLIPKLMGLFMKGLFQKQTQKWLAQFKAFAEKEN